MCLCESGFSCVDGRSRYLYIGLGGYLGILGAHSVQFCFTLWTSASYRVFVYGRYRKARPVLCVVVGPGFVSDITRFYEEQRQPSSGSAWPTCHINGKSGSHCWGGRVRHNLQGTYSAYPQISSCLLQYNIWS